MLFPICMTAGKHCFLKKKFLGFTKGMCLENLDITCLDIPY